MKRTTRCAIGLDVGGTKMAGGLIRLADGVVLARCLVPTLPKRGGEAVLTDALSLAGNLIREAKEMDVDVAGIGVAVAELVDLQGIVVSSNTIAWRGIAVREQFARLAPTVVEADARAAALAETMFGAGGSFKTFLYITVGTGIGSCLVQDGRPYAGAHGLAGTIASSPMTSMCKDCGTTGEQVLEEFAAGPALAARFNQKRPGAATRAEDVLAAVAAGDSDAISVVRSAGELLGSTIGLMVNTLDPEAVIVGGGLGLASGLYWDTFVASTRRHIWSDLNRELPILQARCGVDAGVIGAAAAFLGSPFKNPIL
jgi:glucokinase